MLLLCSNPMPATCECSSRLQCKAINRRVIAGRWVCRKRLLLRQRKFRPPRLTRCNAAPPGIPLCCAPVYVATYKSRTSYIVLGIFLGALGIHNFYAGYTGRAVGQLCLTVLTLGYLGIVSWIWAIIEICIVEKDSTGLRFS